MADKKQEAVPSPFDPSPETQAALRKAVAIARHMLPAFISLATGSSMGGITRPRAGADAVTQFIARSLIVEAECMVLEELVITSGIVKAEEYEALRAKRLSELTDRMADDITSGKAGLPTLFEFQPPKE